MAGTPSHSQAPVIVFTLSSDSRKQFGLFLAVQYDKYSHRKCIMGVLLAPYRGLKVFFVFNGEGEK